MPGYNLPTDLTEERLDENLDGLYPDDIKEAYDWLEIDHKIDEQRMKGWWTE